MKQYVILIVCSFLLLACAQQQQGYWQRPGASQAEFSAERELCMQQAQQPSSQAYVNQTDGADLFSACMTARGWHLVSVTDSKAYSEALGAIGTEKAQLCAREDLQPIFAKRMPCRAKDATPEQLSDRSKISKDEKIAFMRWRILSEESNRKAGKVHQQYNRETGDAAASLIKSSEEAGTKLAEQFYDGRISWGQYNKGRLEIGLEAEQEAKNRPH